MPLGRENKSMDCKNRLRSRHQVSVGLLAPKASNFCVQLGRSAFGRCRQLKLLVSRHPAEPMRPSAAWMLALQCRDHVRGRRIVGGQSVGIELQPQRIIKRPASL